MISTWLLWSRSIHQTQGVRRAPAPSAETETPSLTTVDETSPTTVDTLDTATVVTSDRFDELHADGQWPNPPGAGVHGLRSRIRA